MHVYVTLPCLTGNGSADALECQGHDALGGVALVLCAGACDEEIRKPHPNGMPTVQEVRTMADEELIAHIDQQLGLPPEVRPLTLIQLYSSELQRQEQERRSRVVLAYTQAIDRFTKQMRDMTAGN